MPRHARPLYLAAALLLCAAAFAHDTNVTLSEQVRATETAFAKTLADRDLAAFAVTSTAPRRRSPGLPIRSRCWIPGGWR